MSKKDKSFYEKFENNLCFEGERYCVRLSFTESFSQIPDNFSNSFFRLKNLKVKLQNNDELKRTTAGFYMSIKVREFTPPG